MNTLLFLTTIFFNNIGCFIFSNVLPIKRIIHTRNIYKNLKHLNNIFFFFYCTMVRCPNGSKRNKQTKECEPNTKNKTVKKQKRCPKGSRRNKKTNKCEPKTMESKKMKSFSAPSTPSHNTPIQMQMTPTIIESIECTTNHRWYAYTITMSDPSKNITLMLSKEADDDKESYYLLLTDTAKTRYEPTIAGKMKHLQQKYVGSVYQNATITMFKDDEDEDEDERQLRVDILTDKGTMECTFAKQDFEREAYISTEKFTKMIAIEAM